MRHHGAYLSDLCECGAVRELHEYDADYDGERTVNIWLGCDATGCERFREAEEMSFDQELCGNEAAYGVAR